MAYHSPPAVWSRCLWALLLSSGLLLGVLRGSSAAQITLDGSVGPQGPLHGPHYRIGAELGQLRGSNLFHSFGQFNVPTGGSVTFAGPNTIANILSRVTGGQPSAIDGMLRSEIAGANLYLLNPSGVLFGPNARLEVSGAFHVSTADVLRFTDGATFSADLGQASVLTVAPPEAFGFLGPSPAALTIQGSVLEVPVGQALSLIGGDVDLRGGRLAAPGGDITLVATRAPGDVDLAGAVMGGAARGHLRLSDKARVEVSGEAAGGVRLVGGPIEVTAAEVMATTGARDGRPLTVEAERLSVSAGARLQSGTTGGGTAGAVLVQAEHVVLAGVPNTSTGILSVAESGSTGHAGAVVVHADRLLIDGRGVRELVGIGSLASRGSRGNAGDTQVLVRDIELRDGGFIGSSTFGAGNGGTVSVQAERLVLSGIGETSFPDLPFDPTTIASAALPGATGAAGSVRVIAGTLELRSGGVISSTTQSPGNAGTVTVLAHRLLIDGGEAPVFTAIASTAGAGPLAGGAFGAAGSIKVTAGELEIRGGGAITNATFGSGNAGTVEVQAQRLMIIGLGTFVSPVDQAPFPSRIESSAEPGATGAGGAVRISAHTLGLADHGTIATRSFSPRGNAGDITLRVEGTLELRGGALITTEATQADGGNLSLTAQGRVRLQDSAITASVGGGQTTVGGNLTLSAPWVILEGSRLVANAFEGMGGRIQIEARAVLADAASRIEASSERGIMGIVDIRAPVTSLGGTLAPLPQAFVDVVVLLPARCAARLRGGTASSLVLGGREGLPVDPGGLLPSPLVLDDRLVVDPAMRGAPHQQTSAAKFALLAAHEKGLPRLGCPP
jgi:filamentous hemagglutinin family protein